MEDFVPADHPLRPIRLMVNEALVRLDGLFSGMYACSAKGGRPSIAPEKLLRAMLLQVFYSVRSERQLMEQVQYNLLYALVHRSVDGRCGVGADGVQQEPGAIARTRCGDRTVQRSGGDRQ
ncbi:transposase [Rhizobium mongolense]